VAEHVLEQAGVDVGIPPGSELREQGGERGRLSAAAAGLLDGDQAASEELLACLEVTAAAKKVFWKGSFALLL
jgi:hypothetical protein